MPPPLMTLSRSTNWPICPPWRRRRRPSSCSRITTGRLGLAGPALPRVDGSGSWLATEARRIKSAPVADPEVGAGGNVTTVRHESEHVFCNVDAVATTHQGEPRVAAAGQRRDKLAAAASALHQSWPAGRRRAPHACACASGGRRFDPARHPQGATTSARADIRLTRTSLFQTPRLRPLHCTPSPAPPARIRPGPSAARRVAQLEAARPAGRQ